MAYRELVDDGGVWVVFSTQPGSGANVRPQYANGWLSFHRGAERRRLSPIPHDWENAADDQLLAWLEGSEVVGQAGDEDREDALAKPRSGSAAGGDEGVSALVEPVDSGVAVATAPAATRVQKSIERIRAMLSTIRRDSV